MNDVKLFGWVTYTCGLLVGHYLALSFISIVVASVVWYVVYTLLESVYPDQRP